MIFDRRITEAIRIGEKIVTILPSDRAGHVFGDDYKPQMKHPPRRLKAKRYVQIDKLHRMADWYRPKETK